MLRVPVVEGEISGVHRDFEDGLGRRYRGAVPLDSATPVEVLCFRRELTALPAFEFSLRERFARLSDFQHPAFARIRKIDKLNDGAGTVTLMSDRAGGDRLSRILAEGEGAGPVFDVSLALHLIRQLIAAVAALHQHTRVAHGAIALERLFVTPRGQLIVVEYPLGAALEQLKYSREQYWKELRVALPPGAGMPQFDERTDLVHVGMVALSLLMARPVRDDEYPQQVEHLIASVSARSADGTSEPLPSSVRDWLRRALQLDARNSFRSAFDAQAAFGQVISQDAKRYADAESLKTVVQSFAPSPTRRPAQPTLAPTASVPTAHEMRPWTPREPYEPLPLPTDPSVETFDEVPATDDNEDVMKSAHTRTPRIKRLAAVVALLAATTAGMFAARERLLRPAASPALETGTVTVTTDPPGANVDIV